MNSRRAFRPSLDTRLESREVLSQAGVFSVAAVNLAHVPQNAVSVSYILPSHLPPAPAGVPTIAQIPFAKVGSLLSDVYHIYVNNNGNLNFVKAKYPFLHFQAAPTTSSLVHGDMVSVSVRATSAAALGSLVTTLRNLGSNIKTIAPAYATVSGYIPITQLMTIANSPLTFSMQADASFLN